MNFSYQFKISNLIFLKRDLANFKIFEFSPKSHSISERKQNGIGTYITLGLTRQSRSKWRLRGGVDGSKAGLVQDPEACVLARVGAGGACPFKALVEGLLRGCSQIQLLHRCWLA